MKVGAGRDGEELQQETGRRDLYIEERMHHGEAGKGDKEERMWDL